MAFWYMKQKNNRLSSLEKTLKILLAFQEGHPSWGVRELSAHLGISPATVMRILQTLKSYDFVRQEPQTKKYRLGNVYYNFFQVLQNANPLNQTTLPYLEKLQEKTGETVHFNIMEAPFRVCVNSLESKQSLKASMPIGSRSPLYAGASSKCLLAFSPHRFIEQYLENTQLTPVTENTIINKSQLSNELQKIKKQGYATSLGERNPGLGSLSAPLVNFKGEVLGCFSLAVPELRFRDYDHRLYCIEALTAIAKEASIALGYYDA